MHSEGPSVRPTSITAYCAINESTTPVMTSPRVHPCPPKTRHALSSSTCDSKPTLPVEGSRLISVGVRCMGSFLSWREWQAVRHVPIGRLVPLYPSKREFCPRFGGDIKGEALG